jgi:hypothetical protein
MLLWYHTAFDQWPQAAKHLYVARRAWLFLRTRDHRDRRIGYRCYNPATLAIKPGAR